MPQTHLPDAWAEARILRDRGDLDGARGLLEDNLDTGAFQYGEDHPDVLGTAHLLATLHRQAGDLSAARRVLEEALNAGSLRHPDAEPVMLRLSLELARIADELGNRHEARKHYSRVATHGPSIEGFADPVREALAWLGPQAPTVAHPVIHPSSAPPAWPLDPVAATALPAYDGEPALPSLAGPLQFPARATNDRDLVQFVPEGGPGPAPMPVPVFTAPPTVVVERRGRGPMIAAIAAALVALASAAVAVVVMMGGSPSKPSTVGTSPIEAARAQPASDVELRDRGTSITVTWKDPGTGGTFAVLMGPTADQLRLVTQNLGTATQRTFEGLNPKFDYCFQVATIYSATQQPLFSEVACTRRAAVR